MKTNHEIASTILLFFFLFPLLTLATTDLSVGSHPSKLLLVSTTSTTSTVPATTRVHIHGLSRLRNLTKFAHALNIRVSIVSQEDGPGSVLRHPPNIEICLHRNASRPVGACPVGHWHKLSKGSWTHKASPFGDVFLDIRTPPQLMRPVEVSTEEEFLVHRAVFLVAGSVLMALAHFLSEWVIFYYGSAVAVGIILVILVILFQGMRLLPTGRKSSLAIFLYSSLVGVATFLLSYVSGLLRSMLIEIGISEDMHNPLGILLLVCIALGGAWLGYWGVRKLVLTDDGLVDAGIAYFVEWAIMIFSAVMIIQCSLDALLGLEALLTVLAVIKTPRKLRFLHGILGNMHLYLEDNNLHNFRKKNFRLKSCDYPNLASEPDSVKTQQTIPYEEGTYYSTFHKTPERRKFTKEEWDSLTKDHTRKALRELVSSPDFSQWAASNAERIMVTPPDYYDSEKKHRRFFGFRSLHVT